MISLVTGQIVVYRETTSVVTLPTGQFVTVGAHDVTVMILVEYTVDNVDVMTRLLSLYEVGSN